MANEYYNYIISKSGFLDDETKPFNERVEMFCELYADFLNQNSRVHRYKEVNEDIINNHDFALDFLKEMFIVFIMEENKYKLDETSSNYDKWIKLK